MMAGNFLDARLTVKAFYGARASLLSIRCRRARVRQHDGLVGIADVRRSRFEANPVRDVPAVRGLDESRIAAIQSGFPESPESV